MPDSTPVRMFGTPQDDKPSIPWDEVDARLRASIVYWITAGAAARPVWAVWLGDALWFSTGSSRLWQAFGASPTASAHLEDGHDVVVVEGTQRLADDGDDLQSFCDAYNEKYDWDFEPGKLPGPAVVLTARSVIAWKTGSWQSARTDPFPLASSRFSFS
jgi:hypothetical protein